MIFGINYLTCHCQVCLIFSRLILMNFYVRSEVLSDLITVDIIHKLMEPEDHSHHIVLCFQNQGESFCFNGDQFKFVPFQPIGSNSKEGFLFLWMVMRTLPCWTRSCHGLSQVTRRDQLGHCVRLGFSQHSCTVSMVSPSYGVQMR